MDKREIRKCIRNRKALMPDAQKRAEEAAVLDALGAFDAFRNARTVLSYCSLPDEFSTETIPLRWPEKRIAVPLVDGDSLRLKEFVPGQLEEGYKGIMEPSAELPDISPGDIDFALVPGVAFTVDGKRLGRGKGFYDRLLPQLHCPTAGLAWSCQILEDLPTDPWDAGLDSILFNHI